jgi:hypothetical protein
VILLALDSSNSWKQVDTLPSGTAGGGISNYHVRKDLGKAKAYMVVLEISKIGYRVRSEKFKITAISSHSNGNDDSYSTSSDYYGSEYTNDQDGTDYSDHKESDYDNNYSDKSHYSDYNETDYSTTQQDDNSSSEHKEWDHNDYSSSSDEDSHDSYSSKKPLRIVTPTSATVWQADSYQSVTWTYDGSCK